MAKYSRQYSLLSYAGSTITSRTVLVQDAAELSLSLQTVAGSAVSVEGSNFHSDTTSIPEWAWSNMTVLQSNGIFAIQPGARFLRVRQAASSSSASVQLSMQVR